MLRRPASAIRLGNYAKIGGMEQDLSDFRPTRVWKRLSPERRLAVAEPFWDDEQSTEQQAEAIAAIALHMKFRTKSVLALPTAKRTKYLSTLPTISDSIVARAMVAYHLERQRPMMSAFLDSLGITHENGLIAEETLPKPGRGQTARGRDRARVEVPRGRRLAVLRDARRAGSGHVGGVGGTLSVVGRQSLVVSHSRQSQSAVLSRQSQSVDSHAWHIERFWPCVALAAGLLLTTVLTTAQGGPKRSTLEATLRSMIAASGAEVAVAFRTLDGRSQVLIDPDKPFHAASTMKVPVMIELFRQAQGGHGLARCAARSPQRVSQHRRRQPVQAERGRRFRHGHLCGRRQDRSRSNSSTRR